MLDLLTIVIANRSAYSALRWSRLQADCKLAASWLQAGCSSFDLPIGVDYLPLLPPSSQGY
jgi:hypothetical protein